MEKAVIRAIIFLYLFGISTYLFTTVIPIGKFHTYDTSPYGPTENARYLRTIYDVQEDIDLLFPEVVGWETEPCPVDFQRTLEGTKAIELDCREYKDGNNTIWFFIIYGNETETFHAVESCYSYFGYQVTQREIVPINVQRGQSGEDFYPINITVNTAQIELDREGDKRSALYWMLFNSPQKDASKGAYLYRLSAPVTQDVQETEEILHAMAAASMVATFQDALEDTVIEYYGRNLGLPFYFIIGVIYFVAILFFVRPELLPIY
jgi:hypothetical protein